MTTLVVGAGGRIGRHVLGQLLEAGTPVRACARNPAGAGLPAGVDAVAADLTRPETLTSALRGVHRMFLYARPGGTEGVLQAAQDAGVEHVVLLSSGTVLLPDATDNAIALEHRRAEEVFTSSGDLRCTPIRPLALATNALNWAPAVRSSGTVRMAYADARTAPVHERDVAAVAVAALSDTAAGDVSGLLTGPELLTQRRQAEVIGEVTGRAVSVEELSPDEARAQLSRFMPPPAAVAILELLDAARRGGSPATDTVAAVLGRAPVPFEQWALDHVADFR